MARKPRNSYLGCVASQEIEALANALARLPGLGPRSARRAVLHLMKKRENALQPLLSALSTVADKLSTCSTCGNVDTSDPCGICRDRRRDDRSLCVVEEVADLWALDRSRLFPGRFHVLGGRLSALEGVRPEDLSVDGLVGRVAAFYRALAAGTAAGGPNPLFYVSSSPWNLHDLLAGTAATQTSSLTEKMNAYVGCINRLSARSFDSRKRYFSWVGKKGPTGRERIIYGTYTIYDTSDCRKNVEKANALEPRDAMEKLDVEAARAQAD